MTFAIKPCGVGNFLRTFRSSSKRRLHLALPIVALAGWLAGCSGPNAVPQTARLYLHGVPATLPQVPLSTKDRYIIDTAGNRFKLAGVNWYGASDAFYVPGGLDRAALPAIVALIKEMGFNSIRLPFSNAMLHTASVDPAHVAANPQLIGKSPLEVFDAVIAELTRAGIVVILNNHTTHAMWCCGYDDDGLWYTHDYDEGRWLEDWRQMVLRYQLNPLVVGADLRNEIRITKWRGTIIPQWPNWAKEPNDWRGAAERAAAAIQEINPNILIIVEGINAPRYHLRGVYNNPIRLAVHDKLVYAAHNYGFTRPGLSDGAAYGDMNWEEFSKFMDEEWGYVLNPHQVYTAPVWVSEFGIGPNDEGQKKWFGNLTRYLREKDVDWAVWAINGGPKASGDPESFGYVTDDWSAAKHDFRLDGLQSLMNPSRGPGLEEGWELNPANHLTILAFSDWDTDHRHKRDDWANYGFKASCSETERVVGFSHGLRSGKRYSHDALCSDFGPSMERGASTPLFDNGGDSAATGSHTAGSDWAPGANKLECPAGAVVTGIAQYKERNGYRIAALLCSSGLNSATQSSCSALPLDEQDHRLSQAGDDWDPGHSKTQCTDNGFVAGIALQNGVPRALLCCP